MEKPTPLKEQAPPKKPVAHEQRPDQPLKQIADTQDEAREEVQDSTDDA